MHNKTFRTAIEKTENDIEQIDLLNKTGWEIKASYPKDALEMAAQARGLSQKNNYKEGIACSYRNSGAAYYLLSQYSSALADLQRALLLYAELENKQAEATIIRNIGNVYHSMEQNEKSLECYFKAIQITEQQQDLQGTAYNHGNIGYVYQKIGQYDLALEHMLKTHRLVEEIEDTLGLADVLNNIGKVYVLQEKHEKAYPYFQQSLTKAIFINHLRGIANAHCSLGNFYKTKKEFTPAIEHQSKALAAAEEMGEQLIILDIQKTFSAIYEDLGDYKTSLAYFKKYETIKNEVLNRNNELSITAIQAQHELERSEKEKEIYKLKNIELAKAKEEIEKANVELERLSIVARETENVILIMDAHGRLEWVNASFERLNGITLPKLMALKGETIYEVSNNPRIHTIIAECINEKRPVTYESLNLTRDGKRVWESSTLSPIYDEQGRLRKLIIIDSDITARKDAEDTIRQKNKEITDSINYARRIQRALLTSDKLLNAHLKNYFILYKPKDIVSGDFYWATTVKAADNRPIFYMCCADSTGHGVPGAFMSLLNTSFLNEAIIAKQITQPDLAFDYIRNSLLQALSEDEAGGNDGMDCILCAIDIEKMHLHFACANRPLWLLRNGQLQEYSPDKFPVGKHHSQPQPFTRHTIDLQKEDIIYLTTDGYADQFGGPDGKKFMSKRFKEMLIGIQHLDMPVQKIALDKAFENWKGDHQQLDDVCVIGIKV